MSHIKAFSMTPEQAKLAMKEYKQICSTLEDEHNLAEVREMAKKLDITVSGKKKKDLCAEIAATIYFFEEKDTSIYNMPAPWEE